MDGIMTHQTIGRTPSNGDSLHYFPNGTCCGNKDQPERFACFVFNVKENGNLDVVVIKNPLAYAFDVPWLYDADFKHRSDVDKKQPFVAL